MSNLPTLNEIIEANSLHISDNEFGTDKHYPKLYTTYVYEKIFDCFRMEAREIALLEIGIRSGASLLLWDKYFPSKKILGIDNTDVNIINNYVDSECIDIQIKDAYNWDFIDELDMYFDIIIDDGPHSLKSQIFAVENFTRMLLPGGILFIEDIIGGTPYVDKLVGLIQDNPNYEYFIFDLRKTSKVNDSIVIGIRQLSNSIPKSWKHKKISELMRKLRLKFYSVFAKIGIKRFIFI